MGGRHWLNPPSVSGHGTQYWAVLSKALKHSLIAFNALGNVVTVYHLILFEPLIYAVFLPAVTSCICIYCYFIRAAYCACYNACVCSI